MFASLFLLTLCASVWMHYAPAWVLWLYLAMSAVTFVAYALDKRAARARASRTPESTLHLLGLLGGWPGGRLAQQIVRHKSAKTSFQFVFWFTAMVNVSVLVYVLTPYGHDLVSAFGRMVR